MKAPNSEKAKKIKVLEDKVETLGKAFTNYINDVQMLKSELQSIGIILKNMDGFTEAVEKIQTELNKSKEESDDFDFGDKE